MDFDADDYSARDLADSRRWLGRMLDWSLAPTAPTAPSPAPDPVRPSVDALRAVIDTIDPAQPDAAQVERALLGLSALGRELHAAGLGVPTQTGAVRGVFTSDGGIPKRPVATRAVDVGHRGLVGDRQADRTHHGRPFQAVCLWSIEVIDALVADGHPIAPGLAGENVTVEGVDWSSLRSGAQVVVGGVHLEISGWATPCRKIDQWFLDRSDRIDHARHPGWSRAYAWVRRPGTIALGDVVVVEPSGG